MPVIQAILRPEGTLSHTARATINFLLQENVTFIELDKKWQPNISDLKSVDYVTWGYCKKKFTRSENVPNWSSLSC